MSTRDYAKSLIDQIPDSKMLYIISYLQGAAIPGDEIPNRETLNAFEELDNGGGHTFDGPVDSLVSSLLEDESA